MFRKKIIQNIQHLQDVESKCKDMFCGQFWSLNKKSFEKKKIRERHRREKLEKKRILDYEQSLFFL